MILKEMELVERIDGDNNASVDLLRVTDEENKEKIDNLLEARSEDINKKMENIANIVVVCNGIIESCVMDKLANNCDEKKYNDYKLKYLTESIKAIGLRNNDLIGFNMDEYVLETSAKFDSYVVHTLNELKKLTLEVVKNEKAQKEKIGSGN